MISESIQDVKKFMSLLLVGTAFDDFFVTDVTICTYNTFHIDGHINDDFYSKDEYEELGAPALSSWKTLKPFCYEMIKGKKTPLSFKIIFCLPQERIKQILNDYQVDMDLSNISNLFLNIRFEEGKLSFVTGTSLTIFTLDKSLEHAYDTYISKFISTL